MCPNIVHTKLSCSAFYTKAGEAAWYSGCGKNHCQARKSSTLYIKGSTLYNVYTCCLARKLYSALNTANIIVKVHARHGVIWYYLVLSGTIWYYHLVLFGTIWHYLVLIGTIMYNLVLFGTFWYYLGLFGA